MIMNILLILLLIVIALLGYATTRPDKFHIERSILIKASPGDVFAEIEDFKRWTAWSPWEKIDPTMKRGYSGASKGVGTIYTWEGESKVGAGRMEIVSASQASQVQIKLDFFKPFQAHNTATFTLSPEGELTQVTWAMFGPSPLMSKLMGIFFSMDNMIGKDFEAGLSNLKAVCEK